MANKNGDKTPPCLIPHTNVKQQENALPDFTHVEHIENQFSKTQNI